MDKYFKPKSLTWWASFTPLAIGAFMASEPIHGLSDWVEVASNGTGMSAPVLINLGLAGIGLRGAVK